MKDSTKNFLAVARKNKNKTLYERRTVYYGLMFFRRRLLDIRVNAYKDYYYVFNYDTCTRIDCQQPNA